jgi:hypothetical protein
MSSPAAILDTTRAGILASPHDRDLIADLKARIQSARILGSHRVFSPKCLADAPIPHSAFATRLSLTSCDRNQKILPFRTLDEVVNAV